MSDTVLVLRTCDKDLVRFWRLVDRSFDPGACWPWTGKRDRDGYGKWYPGMGLSLRAHRFALELKLGRSLGSLEAARHSCNNPPCCNPNHLLVGSFADNRRDCVIANRHATGTRVATSKLTADQVAEIKLELTAGVSPTRIARRLGVRKWTIQQIQIGRTWRHVNA